MIQKTSTRTGTPLASAGFAPTRSAEVRSSRIDPSEVEPIIARHMLVDALDLVVDIERSQGAYLYDSSRRRRYLDFFTFVASMPLGLNHPKMQTADFRGKLAAVAVNKPTCSDVLTVEMAEFVQTLERVAMPRDLPHLFLIEGGTLGVENALKAAFDWKIRKNFRKGYKEERGTQVIHFQRAFHGRSGYTLSLTNTDPAKTDLFPKFKWPRVVNPSIRFPLNEENLKAVIELEARALGQIKDAIREREDDIAAIIIEPIQGEGGDNHFRKEFFVELRAIADEHDIMLIFDEVQTGIGLTGRMWASEYFVRPDMIAFGKKVQVCGFMCSRRIDEVPDNVFKVPSRLNSTWGGNLTDMVRSRRYLEIIEEDRLVEHAEIMGAHLQDRLAELQEEFPGLVSNARGRGLFCAVDLRNPADRLTLRNKAFEKGLIILGSGERSLRFRPPLTIQQHELDEGIGILRHSLGEMS